MKLFHVEQNTDEWRALRAGRVTASAMDKIITPIGEKSTQATKYMHQLIAEKISGEPAEDFKGNKHTERGKEWEAEAAEYFAMTTGATITKAGFCTTDDGLVGCSPDYFIGDDELLEIKTGLPSVMIDYYLSGKLEQDHRPQTQSGLLVTGFRKITTMLYNPLMKPIIVSAERNMPYIISMQTMLDDFHRKMDAKMEILRERGYMEAA
jgi:hypothetical protein